MRKISIHQLQKNLSREIQNLPFQITRYHKVVAEVRGPNTQKQAIAQTEDLAKAETPSKESVYKPKAVFKPKELVKPKDKKESHSICPHGSPKGKGLCKHGC